jgi:hypothetical protein
MVSNSIGVIVIKVKHLLSATKRHRAVICTLCLPAFKVYSLIGNDYLCNGIITNSKSHTEKIHEKPE